VRQGKVLGAGVTWNDLCQSNMWRCDHESAGWMAQAGVGAADSVLASSVGAAAGAAAVSVFVGSGTAAAVVVSVLVPFVAGLSEAFSLSFLKRDLSLSILVGLGMKIVEGD